MLALVGAPALADPSGSVHEGLDNPADDHWGPRGEHRADVSAEPPDVGDRARLRRLLLSRPWDLSADPVRAVAVLVVATPCPLLLAAPIAIMSGLSRAAHIGVVIKGGGALERLAAGQVMLFDKTGTLTQGRPGLADVVTAGGRIDADQLLRLAASLDQVSAHVLASAIVTAATSRGLALEMPAEVREVHGYGLEGTVGSHRVRLGKAAWIVGGEPPPWVRQVRRRADLDGSLTVFAAVDDEPAGAFLLEDPIRPDAPRMVRALREAGITRVVLVTGDRADIADMVGRVVGVDTVLADCDRATVPGPPPCFTPVSSPNFPSPITFWRCTTRRGFPLAKSHMLTAPFSPARIPSTPPCAATAATAQRRKRPRIPSSSPRKLS